MFQAHLVIYWCDLLYQPVLQGALVPLSGKWYLEAKIWLLSVLRAVRVSPSLGTLSGQNYGICVCIYVYVHIHTLHMHFFFF